MEELFKEYKKLFSFYSMYIKKMSKKRAIIILLCLGASYSLLNKVIDVDTYWAIGGFIAFLFFIVECDRINKNVYKIKPPETLFSRNKKLFAKYLDENGIDIYNKEQMQYLIKLLDEYIDKRRPKELIKNGAIVAIILPVWNWFISYYYRDVVESFQQAFTFLIYISMAVCLVMLAWNFICKRFDDFYLTVFCGDYTKYKEMKALIENFHLHALNDETKPQKIKLTD